MKTTVVLPTFNERENLGAVAQAILGRVPVTGRLPIRLPPSYPIGHGIRFTTLGWTAALALARFLLERH